MDNVDFTKRLLKTWTESDAFLDDVYTFNIQGITDSLSRLLNVYDSEGYKNICITLTLNSLSGGENQTKQVCANDQSMNNVFSNPIYMFALPLNIGDKMFGEIKVYESNDIYSSRLLLEIIFFVSLAGSVLLFVYYCARFYRLKAVEESTIVEFNDNISEYEKRRATFAKVTSNNKQHFPLNEDVIFVTYEHPYSNLYYKNGSTLSIRCSLSDLESLLIIDFVRLNKSSLVHSLFLSQDKFINFQYDQSLIVIKIKKKNYGINVSPVYKDKISNKI